MGGVSNSSNPYSEKIFDHNEVDPFSAGNSDPFASPSDPFSSPSLEIGFFPPSDPSLGYKQHVAFYQKQDKDLLEKGVIDKLQFFIATNLNIGEARKADSQGRTIILGTSPSGTTTIEARPETRTLLQHRNIRQIEIINPAPGPAPTATTPTVSTLPTPGGSRTVNIENVAVTEMTLERSEMLSKAINYWFNAVMAAKQKEENVKEKRTESSTTQDQSPSKIKDRDNKQIKKEDKEVQLPVYFVKKSSLKQIMETQEKVLAATKEHEENMQELSDTIAEEHIIRDKEAIQYAKKHNEVDLSEKRTDIKNRGNIK